MMERKLGGSRKSAAVKLTENWGGGEGDSPNLGKKRTWARVSPEEEKNEKQNGKNVLDKVSPPPRRSAKQDAKMMEKNTRGKSVRKKMEKNKRGKSHLSTT